MSSENLKESWSFVKAIVEARERKLKKYRFFEKLWKVLEEGKNLIFLQAPTGAGKTEAVLTPYLKSLVSKDGREWHSLIYVMPTKSLVFNMFERICKAVNVCKNFLDIPKRLVVSYDYGGFIPVKPFLEGDITVTTYDTLLYTFYGFRPYGHHILLSLSKIIGSIIILDEVQLLQDEYWYSFSLLPHHIKNLLLFGATVILMSATLPKLLIEDIKDSLAKSRQTAKLQYEVVKADPNEDTVKRGNLKVKAENGRLLDNLLEVIEENEKPLLLIFNTVERAVEAYRKLRERKLKTLLLHSRIVSVERKQREALFEKGDGVDVVIATQVVEAGIDFDFKTVATEISPIDSLIQRLGRCARHRDGEAKIFTDLEQAKAVYPEDVMKVTFKNLDEDMLSDSVRDVLKASELVNNVYTRSVVKQLKSNVHEDLKRILAFVKPFAGKMFDRREFYEDEASNLLRYGVEVRCILLPQDLYKQTLDSIKTRSNKVPLEYRRAVKLFTENNLSISLPRKATTIPALEHQLNSKRVYLSLYFSDEGLEVRKYDEIKSYVRTNQTSYLIINPNYYKEIDGYHLGLVKPFG